MRMPQARKLAILLLSAWLPAIALAQPLLTGEVYSVKAQDIIVPLTSSWQASISMMAEEGAHVAPGDIVVEFDGTEAVTQLEKQRETALAEAAKADRDLATLEKELVQASYALQLAQVAAELADLRAATPKDLIGAIDYAENQLALKRSHKLLKDARIQLADREKSLAERQKQAQLDRQKAELTEKWWGEMLASFTVKASQDGYVIYAKHPWNRSKFQEGDNVQTSFKVAQVADTSDLAIRVWVNSVDRPHIASGRPVKIILDALPGRVFGGRLNAISDSGAKRDEWGGAVYYEGTVSFDDGPGKNLLPGMSALVELQ